MGSAGGSAGSGGSSAAPNPFGGMDPGQLADGVPYTTRVGRLTHTQYDKTVSDLLSLDVAVSSEFEADPVFAGYDNSIENLAVAGRLGRDYRRAAEELAARAVSDATAYQRIAPCSATPTTCVTDFIQTFGRRAYRRPLTAEEQASYAQLHTAGAALVSSGDAFKDGVQVVIEAMLQSPKFLYRTELTQDQQPDGFLKLSGYEIAQRLSYMAWNTMPDEALLEAAANGKLDDPAGLAQELTRLWSDARARQPVTDFHEQWLQTDRYFDLTRDTAQFPAFSSDLGPLLQQETTAFINHVVFDLQRGFPTLFSAPFSFVNADLAPLYGLSGAFGAELQKVELDPALRKGLLTQLGFLASHSYPGETSPIHRGVFIYRRILCKTVPDPVGIDTSQGKVENPRTTREAVEIQTSQMGCVNCHQLFNPLGFAFEHFDAVGQVRSTDRGNPVNTTGQTMAIDGTTVSFQSASELITAISASNDARRCYTDNWLRYALGRETTPADAKTIDSVSAAMVADTYTARDALTELSQSKPFRFRAPNQD
jgi:hypothetical protein